MAAALAMGSATAWALPGKTAATIETESPEPPSSAAASAEEERAALNAELFYEIAEHRWLMSEQLGHDVGRQAAVDDYVDTVLSKLPDADIKVLTDPITEELPVIRE